MLFSRQQQEPYGFAWVRNSDAVGYQKFSRAVRKGCKVHSGRVCAYIHTYIQLTYIYARHAVRSSFEFVWPRVARHLPKVHKV